LGKLVDPKTLNRPASSETEDIIKLFDAGMACARFNLSHGTAKVSYISYNLFRLMLDYSANMLRLKNFALISHVQK
jgi:hypothetical protein